jgi:hypothetical protein
MTPTGTSFVRELLAGNQGLSKLCLSLFWYSDGEPYTGVINYHFC